jgi:hypothetical protein
VIVVIVSGNEHMPFIHALSMPSSSTLPPVTLLAGLLGAGKPTLLPRLLAASDRRRVAVLENARSLTECRAEEMLS